MAPNLASKSIHLHDSFNGSGSSSARPTSLRTKSEVRTEFIVNSIFYHLLEESYGRIDQVAETSASNTAEVEIMEAFRRVFSDFKMSFYERIVGLCSQLEVNSENVGGVFLGVSNELFSEGITWARISTLFVFTSELAAQCLRKELPETIAEILRVSCVNYVEDILENWIKDHGGWEGIITFSKGHRNGESRQQLQPQAAAAAQPPNNAAQSQGWAKNLLHGTVRMFGAFAYIANNTGQLGLPIPNVRI